MISQLWSVVGMELLKSRHPYIFREVYDYLMIGCLRVIYHPC